MFRALLRHRWVEDGRALSAYTHGVAGTLIAIAAEWVKLPADVIATLKQLRRKLGTLPSGLTEKNKALLREFDDVRLCEMLVELPDRLWRQARRDLANSRRLFIDLQSALAIDLLIHVPLRMENLSSLNFNEHLHWPQGRGKPALVVFQDAETKNDIHLEYEIDKGLADRFLVYRNEIAPAVTGTRPDAVFVTWAGRPRTQAAITVAIEKTVLRRRGICCTSCAGQWFAPDTTGCKVSSRSMRSSSAGRDRASEGAGRRARCWSWSRHNRRPKGIGAEVKGARRWIVVLGVNLQPSEFLKPAFVILVAWLFGEIARRPECRPTRSRSRCSCWRSAAWCCSPISARPC